MKLRIGRHARLPLSNGPAFRLTGAAFLLLTLAGCHENRITYDELLQRQRQLAPASQPSIQPVKQLNLTEYRRYTINNGDVLQLTLTGVASDRYTPTVIRARVDTRGEVALPLVGPIRLAGLDYSQAETAVLTAHKTVISEPFAVYIELVGPENTTILVTGAAEAPGLITLPQNERSVLAALSRAGALGVSSSGVVHYKPVDPRNQPQRFDLTDINDVRRILLMPTLQSGDTLIVEGLDSNVLYVTGLVNGVGGAIALPRTGEMTLMRALAAAGGTRELIDVKDATLVRRLDDGSQVRVQVPLDDIFDGKAPDIAVAAGDILQLPHTANTRFQDWLNTNVLRQFTIGLRYDPLQQYNTSRIIDQQDRLGSGGGLRNSVLLNLSNLLLPTAVPVTNP